MPVHAPTGVGKNAKPRRLLARRGQVGVELYRIYKIITLQLSSYLQYSSQAQNTTVYTRVLDF